MDQGETTAREQAIARIERRIAAMQQPIMAAVRDACKRETQLDPAARKRILNAYDEAAAAMYGRYPGDTTAALFQIIITEAEQLTRTVLEQSAAEARAKLAKQPDLIVRLDRRR